MSANHSADKFVLIYFKSLQFFFFSAETLKFNYDIMK